ncbi:M4 family metallopeptidase [Hymenobacter properus]|uniref:M4 family metallopeptidase n=1 Tax=Hymenobacter properus TaxID=2791026 RepID=A0A931BBT6_9BACT|nr:M4 family metallopeptidase [Hymenobacter properus]MBF9140874.1 M4 family metallopeptidase [Hymenobacter properus]MBR7719683.1 M4 family metallopeptidase [Microvirga sp. SRT04]
MKQPLRAGLLGALPLLAAAAVSAQSLPTDGTPQLRALPEKSAAALRQLPTDSRQLLRQELGLRPADDLRALRVETDDLGQRHERFQQYFNGVKVEHGVYTVHREAGVLSGEFKPVPAGLGTKPALSAAAALQRGLAAVGARRYMWDDAAEEANIKRETGNPAATYRPSGELVLVEDYRVADAARRPLVLAWKFNIYAQQPESRAWVYVDARTGDVVLQDAIIKHAKGLVPAGSAAAHAAPAARPAGVRGAKSTATGTFATRYMGSRQVATDLFNGSYRLRDYTRAAGIETYNLRNGTNLATGTDFTDLDNNWTAAEFNNTAKDNAALDAHFGSTQVYDYWMTVHGRNSWDGAGGKLVNYVHYSTNYDNANWNGSAMRYGDGATTFFPLTALDVCAHETGHGVCQATAGLVYLNESGALNEGFSDIWGATIENYVDPTKQTWIVGEDICRTSGGLRSMSNPLSTAVLSPCPANYKGQRWGFGTADNGGVHTNSGVLNHWYYILTVGKTGVNEQQQAYNVTGLGFLKAARIAYRAERLYLTPNSDYRSARMFTIQAAADLYGSGSAEVQAVTDAWFAVGLGNSSAAPAGAQAQCPTDDAAVLTATASTSSVCAGNAVRLTATAAYPNTRRLRNLAVVPVPDGSTTYTSILAYSTVITSGATYQHGLENIYRNYSDLKGVRVRLNHAQPSQLALRLAVRTSTGTTTYLNLASALPTAPAGAAPVALDLTFSDAATAALPATVSGTTLTGTYTPAATFASLAPSGTLATINLEVMDNQVGSAGTVELTELLFNRLSTDVPAVRWTGPGLDATGLTASVTPAAPATGGSATYRYTVLASDPYYGCTSAQDVSVTVSQPVLQAAATQADLCAGQGQAFGAVGLRVTADDSVANQLYSWTGPGGFNAAGKRVSVTPATAGRLRYTVTTATPGTNCTNQQTVSVVARRQATGPISADSVACVGGRVRLRSRLFENQLGGPYRFTGSVQIPDNNPAGVRIPLVVAGSAESFFDLRGISVSITHTYTGDLTLYVEAPDGTRVLLSNMRGGAGQNYQNTVFIDSVGARSLGAGAAPFTGTWQVDEPTGFAKLRDAPQAGTWNLFVVDGGPADVGPVTAWGLVTRDNNVTWTGPNGITANGSDMLAAVPTAPGRYRYIGTTTAGGCAFRDTVSVRVAPGPQWQRRQNTDLALATNWTCLPTPTTDAEVRGGTGAQPVLTTGLVQVRNLTLRAGTALALNGGTLEVYGNLTLEAGATIAGTDGTLSLRGSTATVSAPSGTVQPFNVPRLLVNLPAAADTARLAQFVAVSVAATMQRGVLKTTQSALLNLAGARLTETADSYVSGYVSTTGPLLPGTSQDFGGIGMAATLNSGSLTPGTVSVLRVTDRAIGQAPARTSIRRYYSMSYPQTTPASATLRLSYRDAELNGLSETDVQPFAAAAIMSPPIQAPASGWAPYARTGQSTVLNYVEFVGPVQATWTLSTPAAMLPTRSAAATSFGVQAQPVPFGEAGFSLALQVTKAPRAASVALYDLTGRLLVQRPVAVASGLNAVSLPEAGHLAAGVYVVRVVLDGETQTLRVTRE